MVQKHKCSAILSYTQAIPSHHGPFDRKLGNGLVARILKRNRPGTNDLVIFHIKIYLKIIQAGGCTLWKS